MDPHTGRVLAMSGGFSFEISQFDRATQAKRQPGSAIKPFVYLTALDHGFTPSTLVARRADLAAARARACRCGRRRNYEQQPFRGPTPLRVALEQSLNTVTARLGDDGRHRADRARRSSASASWTTCRANIRWRSAPARRRRCGITAAYAMLVNGGKRITPTLIDRVQDRNGETIFRADQRPCDGCDNVDWQHQALPVDPRHARADRRSAARAYQIVTMLQGVVSAAPARVVKAVGKPIAGKTGTTNDWHDAWFVGFTPDLVAGVYVGFDDPDSLGKRRDRRRIVAAPIFRDFMMAALKDAPATAFRTPPGHAARTGSARRPACRPAPASRRSTRPTSPAPSPARTAIVGSRRRPASDETPLASTGDRRRSPLPPPRGSGAAAPAGCTRR